jgi:FKBP-type peptidyl-prolyl cis-trans isomerase
MKKTILLCLAVVFLMTSGYSDEVTDAEEPKDTTSPEKVVLEKAEPAAETEKPKEPEMITNESGLRYQDLAVGEGKEAVDSMRVDCHYTLWFADSTGLEKTEKIQSSKDGDKSFQCQIGVGLIPGWSEGMVGMKEGGTRLLYVPWELGYGANGHPSGMIPGKTNLIFEIDFIKSLSE